jgi:uncharacterized repeat protein (TIGR03847 family)
MDTDFDPVDHITFDAVGQPGQRVFYLQAWSQNRTITFLLEKIQIQTLAIGYENFLEEIDGRFPNLPEASADYVEDLMHIRPPLDPFFRVGEMALAYDADRDLAILTVKQVAMELENDQEAGSVRLWCSRSQLRALCAWGLEVARRGRPICPYCGLPMEPEGHFCPKKNGHKRKSTD